MSEHKITLNQMLGAYLPICLPCRWFGNDEAFDTEAEARAAYEDHVYSAVGREAVEGLRDIVKPCGNVEESRKHYRRARALLATVDKALRKED